MDQTDKQLLSLLQRNGQISAAELGDTLNLSASQASRRRQRLESSGFVTHYAARLDPGKLGLDIQAFIQVQLTSHGADTAKSIARLVQTQPDIINAWTMTGEADYLLHAWTKDLPALNRLIHDVILAHPAVARVQSQIVMEQLKQDAPLPI